MWTLEVKIWKEKNDWNSILYRNQKSWNRKIPFRKSLSHQTLPNSLQTSLAPSNTPYRTIVPPLDSDFF